MSLQLHRYLRDRRAGVCRTLAASAHGILPEEARLHDEAEAAGNYADLDISEAAFTRSAPATPDPRPANPQPTAPAAVENKGRPALARQRGLDGAWLSAAKDGPGAQPQEHDMARGKRKVADQVVEVKKPDFDLARRIYFNDIKPAQGKVGLHAQEMSTAFKEIAKVANVDRGMAKLAFKLSETEESKREHMLRSLKGMLEVLRIYMPRDLVDVAEGKPADDNVIPIGEASRPQLATIPGDDSDLAGETDTDDAHQQAAE